MLRTIATDLSDAYAGDGFTSDRRYKRPKAPGCLWLFGERGIREMECRPPHIEMVRRVFPEAMVWHVLEFPSEELPVELSMPSAGAAP
jgi:hypothetical protein